MNRWLLEMREYNYEIKFLKGKDNFVADHLSRPVRIIVRPPEVTWLSLDKPEFVSEQTPTEKGITNKGGNNPDFSSPASHTQVLYQRLNPYILRYLQY